MWRIGLKMLMGDRAKYFTLVGSVSVVVFLFIQQGSVFCGLIGRTAKPVEAIGAPIWVVDRNLQVVDEFKGLLDTDLLRVRSVEGVKWAVPLFIRQAQVRLPNGKFQAVRLVGIDSATLVGRPPRLLEGRIEDLNAPDAVIVGRAEMERLGSPKIGDTFEINDRRARVVGIADVPRDFLSNPYLYTTFERAVQYVPRERKLMNYILAAPKEGYTTEQVLENIQRTTGLAAYDEDGMRWLTMNYYLRNTGIRSTSAFPSCSCFWSGWPSSDRLSTPSHCKTKSISGRSKPWAPGAGRWSG
jgi:putative ABC transport system permease protein